VRRPFLAEALVIIGLGTLAPARVGLVAAALGQYGTRVGRRPAGVRRVGGRRLLLLFRHDSHHLPGPAQVAGGLVADEVFQVQEGC
jgi:hypothetical protein